jgi:hypothetical protein
MLITDSIFREGETAEALRGMGILADLEGRVVMVAWTKKGCRTLRTMESLVRGVIEDWGKRLKDLWVEVQEELGWRLTITGPEIRHTTSHANMTRPNFCVLHHHGNNFLSILRYT